VTIKFAFDNANMTNNQKIKEEAAGLEIICNDDTLSSIKSSHHCHVFAIYAGNETFSPVV